MKQRFYSLGRVLAKSFMHTPKITDYEITTFSHQKTWTETNMYCFIEGASGSFCNKTHPRCQKMATI